MTEVTALFVYGTLKPGEANWPLLAPYARSTSRAWMRGCLHDAGCFPALGEGDDMVYGELVRVATRDLPVVLLLLDHLEGCILYDPGRSFFTRRLTDVVTDDGTVQA
ncbi:MAG: gamma-glutamylcyclotransferase, partial [Chloroflexi bacterium]|nr:gamma-glutamylcyclotransferase [Chloroflexota bacterium]